MVLPRGHAKKRTNVRFIIGFLVALFLPGEPAWAATSQERSQEPTGGALQHAARLAADSALRQGAALVASGQWDDARRAFERAIRWDPTLAVAHFNLGVALSVLGRSEDALQAYREALRLVPTLSDALVNIGVELFKQGQTGEALVTLKQAVRMAPMSAAPYHNLGVLLASLGELDEAVAALQRAADLAPTNAATRRALADTHYNIGVRHARRQRWSQAVASYETAIGFDRRSPEAFNGAGIALRRLHYDRAAVAMFDEALRLRPSFAEARYNLAGALAALGRYGEAMESCRSVLELQPGLREAIQLLDSLRRTLMPDARLAGA